MPMALSMCVLQPVMSFFAIISLAVSISFMAAAFLVVSVIFIIELFAAVMFASEQSIIAPGAVPGAVPCAFAKLIAAMRAAAAVRPVKVFMVYSGDRRSFSAKGERRGKNLSSILYRSLRIYFRINRELEENS